jgi:tetrahydromethanopterin S-methyltransferase subunit D
LKLTAISIAIFGPVFSLGTIPATVEPARWSLDPFSWPLDGTQTCGAPTTRFLTAITGGFLLGMGLMVWFLATRVHALTPQPVRKAVVAGLIAWFLLDSAGSIASGNASHAGFNIIVLLILVGPLWWPPTSEPG